MKPDPKSNRRDFLTAKPAFRNNGEVVGEGSQSDVERAAPDVRRGDALSRQHSYLEHFSKTAMACHFELFLNLHQYSNSGNAAMAAFERIDQCEDIYSVFRQASEISKVNRLAGAESVSVSSQLADVLGIGLRLSLETEGAFDMTSHPLSKLWGFHHRNGRVPEQSEIDRELRNVGFGSVEFESVVKRIRFGNPKTSLNLGGIGKGHALDLAADEMLSFGVGDFVLHGGQSSVVARGRETKSDAGQERGWSIGLSHPTVPEKRIAEIILSNQSLGTSGTARQGFFHQGKRYGHIIDPRTGWPSDHCLSSTVIGDSTAEVDALATAFFVMEPDFVANYCEQHKDVKAILVLPESRTGRIRIETYNLDEQEFRVLV